MTIDDVKEAFRPFDAFIEPVSKLSFDDDNQQILCNLSERAYNYDKIVNSLFVGQDVFKSFDAISFSKDGCVNFIEFKNAEITKKQKDGIRGKVVEGIHYIERVILQARFLSAQDIPTRFILVYSEEKNQRRVYHESQGQRELNDGLLSFSSKIAKKRIQPFIGNRFDEKWKYVDKALSMTEKEFMQRKDEFL